MQNGTLKSRLLAVAVPEKVVEVAGERVLVRGLTVAGRDSLSGVIANGMDYRPRVVILSAFDPDTGDPLFTDDDADQIAGAPADLFEPIIDAMLELTSLDAEEVAELEGN